MNTFRSAENMSQVSELNTYANSLRQIEEEKGDEQERINEFNEKLRGITDPIGGILAGKPLEEVVKSGVKKALGYGAKQVESKLTDVLKKAVTGDLSSFGKNLPSNTTQSIQALLQDKPTSEIQTAYKGLSQKAKDTINQARKRLGKSSIKESETPESTTPTTEPQPVNEPVVAPAEEDDLENTENLDQVKLESRTLRNRFNQLPEETQAQIDQEFQDHPDKIGNPETTEDYSNNLDIRQQLISRAEQEQGIRPPPEQPSQADELDADEDFQGTQPFSQPQTINQESEATEGADAGGDTSNVINSSAEGSEITGDTVSGIEDAVDALDAISAGTAEIPIVGEIFAGIAGIATILGGTLGGKAPAEAQNLPLSSGVQFGV